MLQDLLMYATPTTTAHEDAGDHLRELTGVGCDCVHCTAQAAQGGEDE